MIGSDANAWKQISTYLPAGEKLVWAGRPAAGLRFRRSDFFFVPFGVFWFVFGAVIVWGSLQIGSAWALLFGLPFGLCSLAIGLFCVVGRYFYDAWVRARTVYGLTDRRLVIVSKNPSPTLDMSNIRNITNVTLSNGRGGEGNIRIDTDVFYSGDSDYRLAYDLDLIPDAHQVYRLIKDVKRRSQPSGTQGTVS